MFWAILIAFASIALVCIMIAAFDKVPFDPEFEESMRKKPLSLKYFRDK